MEQPKPRDLITRTIEIALKMLRVSNKNLSYEHVKLLAAMAETMVALAVDSKEKVHAVYEKALELGGTDEGPPGLRGDLFYAGYFRDLDGNKLNVFYANQDE